LKVQIDLGSIKKVSPDVLFGRTILRPLMRHHMEALQRIQENKKVQFSTRPDVNTALRLDSNAGWGEKSIKKIPNSESSKFATVMRCPGLRQGVLGALSQLKSRVTELTDEEKTRNICVALGLVCCRYRNVANLSLVSKEANILGREVIFRDEWGLGKPFELAPPCHLSLGSAMTLDSLGRKFFIVVE
jgi:hypothetical protein